MIEVNYIYSRLRDLTRKDQNGYMSNDEFNRHLKDAVRDLVNERIKEWLDKPNANHETLGHITREKRVYLNGGKTPVPSDCYSAPFSFVSESDNKEITPHLATDVATATTSKVRGSKGCSKFKSFVLKNGEFVFHGLGDADPVKLVYVTLPLGNRAVALDTVNAVEVYDGNNSVNVNLPEKEVDNILRRCLHLYSLPTAKPELSAFAKS